MNLLAQLPASIRAMIAKDEAQALATLQAEAAQAGATLAAMTVPQALRDAITAKAKATAAREKAALQYDAAVYAERDALALVNRTDDTYQRERLRLAKLAHPAEWVNAGSQRLEAKAESYRSLGKNSNEHYRACVAALALLNERQLLLRDAPEGIGEVITDIDAFVVAALDDAQKAFDAVPPLPAQPSRNQRFYSQPAPAR